ncbi:Metallo-dependent phosphatase [Lojkania enalia]|uniref:Metallo-dependent phosphatase n=1 Tax=Lojkania enalia TaxID=147567 RepID=A0A9P4K680_9PLEO|nr:Metallo-dependent phosphatase [Didymosphaeria enalia]
MGDEAFSTPQMRKTRIVCISDTHNQTPRLPKGDVLIHAGDLTNQGSFSEMKKMVDWLENANFEAKIVVAGNHDITLDAPFYAMHGSSWRWPKPQDPEQCRKLFTDSSSITYLENEAASIYLRSANGPQTCFKVYGSPCTPKRWNWAFQYEKEEAPKLWGAIPMDTDIVVTHTPPSGHCDTALKDERSGCEALLRALHRVRPLMAVCGHIHEGRGVERLRWNLNPPEKGSLREDVEKWNDPGLGNNRQSLEDLTAKGGRPLNNYGALLCQSNVSSLTTDDQIWPSGGPSDGQAQFRVLKSTCHTGSVSNNKANAMTEGTIECRQAYPQSDIGLTLVPDVGTAEGRMGRRETCVINAAFMGPRNGGGPKRFNKPIVVDIDLPVWIFQKPAQ